jgi:hypothetical protein
MRVRNTRIKRNWPVLLGALSEISLPPSAKEAHATQAMSVLAHSFRTLVRASCELGLATISMRWALASLNSLISPRREHAE